MRLIDDTGAYCRRGVMQEAWRLHRRAAGRVTFADCLRLAWARAREAREIRRRELATFDRFLRRAA